MKPIPAVCITGGIASGKSTVLRILRDLGWETASSDEISAEVFQMPDIQDFLRVQLGNEFTRSEVRARLASDPDFRKKLNRLMHPLIAAHIETLKYDAIEVPLAIETCMFGWFKEVWATECGREIQIQRLAERGIFGADAEALLRTQVTENVRSVFANRILRTNLPESSVFNDIVRIAHKIERGGLH